DKVYSRRGYYLDPFTPDLTNLALPQELVEQLDPLFHLVLDVGNRAWQDAQLGEIDRRQIGVILGNICLPTDKSSELAREFLGRASRQTHALNRYVAGLPAGLLAEGLALGGGSFTLDAACASSLFAIKLASEELQSGRATVMLAGGCSRPDSLYTQMGFSQLRALSPSGRCSPFDAAADGLMVGEGAGVFVLRRLSDAQEAGQRILAVLHGAGTSNDIGGNLLAPAKEGQLRAMRAAYTAADWNPQTVQLIECHATGTPVGDAVEFESLRELWTSSGLSIRPGQCIIGSVKSTVGHLLTGAGSAALAKVLLAIEHGTLPPQANFRTPGPNLAFEESPFRVLEKPQPWETTTGPRRAAVSGFGFGGVNAHLLVQQWQPELHLKQAKLVAVPPTVSTPIAIVGVAAQVGPWDPIHFREAIFHSATLPAPVARENGWGETSEPCPPGYFLETLRVPLDRFRIPPVELEEMLPQQLLMLMVAAAALEDTRTSTQDATRTGVLIGLG
ncbi:MAG: beta-ketoacyl synthase N-terminal-like domain-containing protein, partial [Gemmataceae bacterium]